MTDRRPNERRLPVWQLVLRFSVATIVASFLGGFVYFVAGLLTRLPSQPSGDGSILSLIITIPLQIFLVVWLGSAAGALIALWIVGPLLLVGMALTALQRIWRPARHWLLWAAVGVAAALVVFPRGGPLPDAADTAAAICAGLVAALSFRRIALPNRSVDWSKVSALPLLVGAALITAVIPAALRWRTDYAEKHQFDVRYQVTSAFSRPTSDRTPVDLVLHQYGDVGRERGIYWTTGRTLRFRIPKAYFHEEHLQRGGGQRQVRFHADARRLQPVGRRAPGEPAINDIAVALTFDPDGNFGRRAAFEYEGDPDDFVGELCGMRFMVEEFRPEVVNDMKARWPASFSSASHQWTAWTAWVSEPMHPDVTGASCAAPGKCLMSFNYRGATGRFWIDRDRFCEWPRDTARVVQFLDRHLVGETQQRADARERLD